MNSYAEFLRTKGIRAQAAGIDPGELPESLFPFQRDIVRWSLRKGRTAIFADCGMGKTAMQLAWADRVVRECGVRVLILAPLAVARQTVGEGAKFGVPVTYVRDESSVGGPGVWITNYEMLSRFTPSRFDGIVLDESSILKSYDGKTRTTIIESFRNTAYRLACTATPAPNDFMELGNHAEFLGVMSRPEMLATFFVHDGGDTSQWRLKGHAQDAFWQWVCSWAVMIRKPSDLGYDDGAFVLPELRTHEHVVAADTEIARRAGLLFAQDARSLVDQREARKSSLPLRVEECARIVNATPGSWLVWCELNAEGDSLTKSIDGAVQVSGSDSHEDKADKMAAFTEGRTRVLVTKPSVAGFGMNWQHCHQVAFVGLSNSYEQFYQAVRRCWRFGQTMPVECHLVSSDAEGAVMANIQRKEADAVRMAEEMVRHMSEIQQAEMVGRDRDVATHAADVASGEGWTVHLGDCVDVARSMPPDSIDFSVFSPPFASLYTYSNSDRDMGNCRTHDEFFEHFSHLVPELLRVTKPGRLVSFHCMNLPTSKARDGIIGLTDFRGTLIRAFTAAGWVFHSEVVIWKDPVTAMQRTKALGLLHKQIKKDSCMSRQGIPDYLVTMRKPGDNVERVSHTAEDFPVQLWQRFASPVWMDINPSDTIQFRSAREDNDERHICPLQLDVIRRALKMWSNPGDLVFSPFTGIGSEGYVAIEEGRRFVGAELKRSYWEQAAKNIAGAMPSAVGKTLGLFG